MTHPQQQRRTILKGTLLTALATTLGSLSGLLHPIKALAADWPKDAFSAKKIDDAITALFGTAQTTPSASVKLKVPAQAENSAQVQIQVSADLPNIEGIAILVEKNPTLLVAHASFTGAEGFFSARMKMAQTSDVYAVVKSGGKLYLAKQTVKVTVGGCGG